MQVKKESLALCRNFGNFLGNIGKFIVILSLKGIIPLSLFDWTKTDTGLYRYTELWKDYIFSYFVIHIVIWSNSESVSQSATGCLNWRECIMSQFFLTKYALKCVILIVQQKERTDIFLETNLRYLKSIHIVNISCSYEVRQVHLLMRMHKTFRRT